ncbi:MAG: hypothetical protein PHY23_10040 [Oscillospiraceae bacterium]|nr:hypothetical protein [Oscillospiraceae bacterium]MDD4511227.1 hypothetical protein [Oscillospiraceae bacterium]
MKKKIPTLLLLILLLTVFTVPAFAASNDTQALDVRITSPTAVEMKPIYAGDITAEVTNNSSGTLNHLNCFLSVFDVDRGLSYNVDEFGEKAYVAYPLSLAPGETATVTIPVKVNYVGNFRFTVTVLDLDSERSCISQPLTVHMLTASELNKTVATIVAVIMPILCLSATLVLFRKRKIKS